MSEVGVNVFEIETVGGVVVAGAATSVTGILGVTERGLPNVPVRITSTEGFRRRFGYYRQDANTAHAIDLFFANGGSECICTRVVGAGHSPATVTLSDRQPVAEGSLVVSGGFRGRVDPGPWGTNVQLDVRDDPRLSIALAADAGAGVTNLQLASVEGLSASSVVRISDAATSFYRRLDTVDAATSTITFIGGTPAALAVVDTVVQSAEFRLIVQRRVQTTAPFETVEDWRHLSMEADSPDYAVSRLNNELRGSAYVVLRDVSLPAAPVGEKNPQIVSGRALTGGSEGTLSAASYIGDTAQRTGVHAFFDEVPPLLITPDLHALGAADVGLVNRAMLDFAQTHSAFYIGTLPDRGASTTPPRRADDYTEAVSDYVTTITTFMQPLHAAKVFGAWYGPNGSVFDPVAPGTTKTRYIALDAAVAGIFAKTERERGLHKAPAGVTTRVAGVNAVSAEVTDPQNTHVVRVARANLVRTSSRGGVAVSTSRTASSDPRWFFVNVRRLFNFVVRSLQSGMRPFVHEVHNAGLRRRVKDAASAFLAGLHRNRAFGQGTPEQTYRVKCDLENNSPEDIRLGQLNLDVSFFPSRPAEEINVTVGLDSSGVLTNET